MATNIPHAHSVQPGLQADNKRKARMKGWAYVCDDAQDMPRIHESWSKIDLRNIQPATRRRNHAVPAHCRAPKCTSSHDRRDNRRSKKLRVIIDKYIIANPKTTGSQSITEPRKLEEFNQVYAIAREQQKLEADNILLQEKGSDLSQMKSELQDSRFPLKEESPPHQNLERQLRKQIQVLQTEKALYADEQVHRLSELEDEVNQLADLNRQLNRQIWFLQRQNADLRSQSLLSAVTQRAGPEELDQTEDSFLALANKEILQKDSKLNELNKRLGDALKLNNMLKVPTDGRFRTGFVNIRESASSVNYNIKKTARSMARWLKKSMELPRSQELEAQHPELHQLIQDSISSVSILLSKNAIPALSTLVSSLVRDQIFYSDTWTMLGRGELMLEEYRNLMRLGADSGFLRRFDHAAYHSLATNSDFRRCYLPARAQSVALDIFEILCPLFAPRTQEKDIMEIKRSMETLCKQAFEFRASLLLHDLRKYEMVLYKPGDLFHPGTMEAYTTDGDEVELEDDRVERHIKLCMHGLIMEYDDANDTESVEGKQDSTKTLGKEFIVRENGIRDDGKLVTDKAVVILEEN